MVHIFYGERGQDLHGDREHHLNQNSPNVAGTAETGDLFGSALEAGDFNGDGIDDLAVGAPGEGIGDRDKADMVHIFYGERGQDLHGDREHHLNQNSPNVAGTAQTGDLFGGNAAIN